MTAARARGDILLASSGLPRPPARRRDRDSGRDSTPDRCYLLPVSLLNSAPARYPRRVPSWRRGRTPSRKNTATSSRTRKDRPEERKDETQTTTAPRQSNKFQRIRKTTSAPKKCALRGSFFAHLRIARAHVYRIARKCWSLFAQRRAITGAFFVSPIFFVIAKPSGESVSTSPPRHGRRRRPRRRRRLLTNTSEVGLCRPSPCEVPVPTARGRGTPRRPTAPEAATSDLCHCPRRTTREEPSASSSSFSASASSPPLAIQAISLSFLAGKGIRSPK